MDKEKTDMFSNPSQTFVCFDDGPPLNPTPPDKPFDGGVTCTVNDELMIGLESQSSFKDMLLRVKERVSTIEIEN